MVEHAGPSQGIDLSAGAYANLSRRRARPSPSGLHQHPRLVERLVLVPNAERVARWRSAVSTLVGEDVILKPVYHAGTGRRPKHAAVAAASSGKFHGEEAALLRGVRRAALAVEIALWWIAFHPCTTAANKTVQTVGCARTAGKHVTACYAPLG
jgi:hypothetical protein